MITQINVDGFKAIDKEELSFKPITLLIGANSSGKSSILQSIIQLQSYINLNAYGIPQTDKEKVFGDKFKSLRQPFLQIRNKNINARKVEVLIKYNNGNCNQLSLTEEKDNISVDIKHLSNLHYLSANRKEFEAITLTNNLSEDSIDYFGYNTPFILTKNRNLQLRDEVCFDQKVKTLDYQLDYWLSKIINQKISIVTENKEIEQFVTFYYSMNDLSNIAPNSVGTGQNNLVHILLMCLLAKKDDIVIIENPELHLHPKAQAILSDFFTMIANSGVQLILETHSEHIPLKFCYNVYKESLDHNKIIIHYKSSEKDNFIPIYINQKGRYSNKEGQEIQFPSGFFDATLQEVLEIS
ncbi:AAA family ATPase [Commensalibacter papalotli (ex Servin-Garciduenas et al. 2014)]|uniref:Endonuclease GajA/Old nuclease/RecF-like AAA domain-containing protein n=1 Tax=Commensalibacter papalotli (ex Servin-Garciduenas et al. 2014) TaxID=1208583 RepID=W7E180_9PROT|nr:AAA family ATPase [Commensalibacter papalotli (ex Servin-Garciduenas et al. 2014)]EUK18809.1 hypothetical protein COMX_03635 [Commensalibacter papalotli (ex Servin-Garciduenas et al. 2014)]